ncbi:MAG: thioredoxin domain-containing protein [Deltaproteobacteria bacterium]
MKDLAIETICRISIILLLLSSQPFDALSDTYMCTDEEGSVTYKTSPCPSGHKSEIIKSEAKSRTDTDSTPPSSTHDGYDYEQQHGSYDKVKIISRGRLINVIDYIEPGKYTAFMFYADWCAPCKTLKPKLEEFARDGDTLALREIDIINWENPLPKYYNLPSLPYFIIYGPEGEFIERGPAITNETMRAISRTD